MKNFDFVVIELTSEDPTSLASFYSRLFGLTTIVASDDAAQLQSEGFRLVIKRGSALVDETSTAWGLSLADRAKLDDFRNEALNAGAVVLAETKREAAHRVAFQDPSGNEFFAIVATPTGANEALVAVPKSATPTPAAHEAPASAAPRPNRRMVDQLMDKVRMAEMQEAIAGLVRPFSSDDPSFTLDEMRMKIGEPATPHENHELARAEAEMKAKAADDLLARYKAQVQGTGDAPNPSNFEVPKSAESDPRALDSEKEMDETRPVQRTLGGAPDDKP